MRNFRLEIKSVLGAWNIFGRGEKAFSIEKPRECYSTDTHRVLDKKMAAGVLGKWGVHAKISFTTLPGWPSVRVCS